MTKKIRISVPEAKELSKRFTKQFHEYFIELGKVRGLEFELGSDFPTYVRAIRVAHGQMTQADLAAALKVDHTYISKIEGGKTPSYEFMERLAFFVMKQKES